ncbi:hypothetical protein QL285_045763 [Trifolium repens]|nr:hypothetical protein QL285_045763 [Trifolium repens]
MLLQRKDLACMEDGSLGQILTIAIGIENMRDDGFGLENGSWLLSLEMVWELIVNVVVNQALEELNKYDNEAGTSQSVEEIQSHMPWKDDIYSKVKGPDIYKAIHARISLCA